LKTLITETNTTLILAKSFKKNLKFKFQRNLVKPIHLANNKVSSSSNSSKKKEKLI
jgi:hypothetical protein